MILLCANDSCIEIDTTNRDWCRCWLVFDSNKTYIGSESLKYLKDHFLAGLDDNPKKSSGQLHGYNFSWVLSLTDAHTTLYIAVDGQARILLLEDENGKDICMIKLSKDQILDWRNQMSSA